MTDDLGVIVVNYKRDASAIRAMESIIDNARQSGLSCSGVLCDNSRTITQQGDERFDILGLPNPGYAAAVNAAIARLDTAYYLIATHETEIAAGSVAELIETVRAAGHAAVGPLLIDRRDGSVFSAGIFIQRGRPEHIRRRPSSPTVVDSLDGACWLVSAEVWNEVGELRESFFLYWEETDWMTRAARLGYDCINDPSVEVYAEPNTEAWKEYFLRRNKYYYLEEHRSRLHASRAAGRDLLWGLPRALGALILRPREWQVRMARVAYRLIAIVHWLIRRTGPGIRPFKT